MQVKQGRMWLERDVERGALGVPYSIPRGRALSAVVSELFPSADVHRQVGVGSFRCVH